jgi:hypothetical protein
MIRSCVLINELVHSWIKEFSREGLCDDRELSLEPLLCLATWCNAQPRTLKRVPNSKKALIKFPAQELPSSRTARNNCPVCMSPSLRYAVIATERQRNKPRVLKYVPRNHESFLVPWEMSPQSRSVNCPNTFGRKAECWGGGQLHLMFKLQLYLLLSGSNSNSLT